jgi:AcrR family transcriptional regulator
MVKKQLIIENSLKLFSENGFEATSIQQITELCGISKGAFYLSFKSKDELIIALIDYFFMQITSEIDRSVRTPKTKDLMLYEFYHQTFLSFSKQTSFVKILFKEHVQPINEQLLIKLNDYDFRINESILYLIQQLYGDDVQEMKYDLLICIKGFMKIYVELFLHYNVKLDMHVLAKSLAEKTDIIARNATTPFLTKETYQLMDKSCHDVTTNKDQLITLIKQVMPEIEDPLEMESLEILLQNIRSPKPSLAIVKGLIENLKNNPQCKWIAYLSRDLYQL